MFFQSKPDQPKRQGWLTYLQYPGYLTLASVLPIEFNQKFFYRFPFTLFDFGHPTYGHEAPLYGLKALTPAENKRRIRLFNLYHTLFRYRVNTLLNVSLK